MSTKKQLRQARRAAQRAERQKGRGAGRTVAIVVGVLVLLLAAAYAVDRLTSERPGPPPAPGMVWSEAHGHWH